MKIKESQLRKIISEAIIQEMDANLLQSKFEVESGDGKLHVSFGKNGWGLTDEFLKIHEIVSRISHHANIYLEECKIDPVDDVYDFYFKYSDHGEDNID